MIHSLISLPLQLLLWVVFHDAYAAAATCILVFVMREITQAEYRWIEANGGLRAYMPWWKGLDIRLWNEHSVLDVGFPIVTTLLTASLMTWKL